MLDDSDNTSTVGAAHRLLRMLVRDPRIGSTTALQTAAEVLDRTLIDAGLEGLWATCTAKPTSGDAPSRKLVRMTERLVEASLL